MPAHGRPVLLIAMEELLQRLGTGSGLHLFLCLKLVLEKTECFT